MEETQEEIKELRSKDICEQQLAVELAVGAVDSIDSLIDQGHEIACEYACQLLFDNLRKKVAMRSNLPIRIVQHLLKDRCEDIRLTITRTNWSSLTTEQQEKVINEAELLLLSSAESKKYDSWNMPTINREIIRIIEPLLEAALHERDEPTALRYIKILGIHGGLPTAGDELIPTLKEMPKVFMAYWTSLNEWNRKADLILAHPDEDLRMKEIQRILNKETKTGELHKWKESTREMHPGNLKTRILKLWVVDPSEKIRQLIASTTTNVDVLEMLATDVSNTVSQAAYPRYKKFQKRATYSKAYNKRKKVRIELSRDKEA